MFRRQPYTQQGDQLVRQEATEKEQIRSYNVDANDDRRWNSLRDA